MPATPDPASRNRAGYGLDAANFFLADVRAGLGPYLAIYLLTVQKWDPQSIGLVMSIATIAGVVAQTPAGALVDATRAKRGLLAAAAVMATAACLLLPWLSSFWAVALSQASAQPAAAALAPALTAVTLGIVGRKLFAWRVGRNEFFNHAGNVVAAAIAGVLSWRFGPVVVFHMLATMAIASLLALPLIPGTAIDHDVARGLDPDRDNHLAPAASGWTMLFGNRPLLIFVVSVLLFHLANAAMLPLVGQQLASQDDRLGTTLMSVCIVAAQLVMLPMALLVGARADCWGRKPLFLSRLFILTLRAVLYTLSDNPIWLLSVQLLDGVGAGIFGAIFPVIVADVTRGSGHFNLAQGPVNTAQGVGAALSESCSYTAATTPHSWLSGPQPVPGWCFSFSPCLKPETSAAAPKTQRCRHNPHMGSTDRQFALGRNSPARGAIQRVWKLGQHCHIGDQRHPAANAILAIALN